jgi:copper transport protein
VTPVRRRLSAILAALFAVVGFAVLPAAPASAHAQVISSLPSDGQRVETSPRELVVTLSEAGRLPSIVVSLVGPNGPVTALGTPVEKSRDDRGRQTIGLPVTADLPTGLYRMTFTVTSAWDGHTTQSQLLFGVRTDVAAPIGGDGSVSTDSVGDAVRGAFQGVMLIASGIAFGLLVLMPAAGGRGRRAAGVLGVVALVAAVATGVLAHEGNGLVVAASGALGAGMLAALARWGRDTGRAQTWLACVALVVAVAPLALVGHAAAQGDLMTMVAVLHMVATAAWVGAVVAAAVLTRGVAGDARRPVLRRTSAVGATTFLVAIVTGLLMSQAMVPSVGGLLGSSYGWGLVVKAALLLPVLALALLTRERLRFGRSTSVRVEAGLLVTVAVVGVFVATQPPPAAPRYQPTPTWSADTAAVAVQADDLLISTQIDPNTPGTRFLVARVDNTRRPAPAVVTAVTASLGEDAPVSLVQNKDGLWTASVVVADAGPTSLHVTVTRPGMSQAVATTTWNVGVRPGTYAGGSPLSRYVAIAIAGLIISWLLVLLIEGLAVPRRRVGATDVLDLTEAEQEPVSV